MRTRTLYDDLLDLFVDKISGKECLYKSGKRKSCLQTKVLPNSIGAKRPSGWCEICWLTYQLEEVSIMNIQLRTELSKFKERVLIIDKLAEDVSNLVSVGCAKHAGQLSLNFDLYDENNLKKESVDYGSYARVGEFETDGD